MDKVPGDNAPRCTFLAQNRGGSILAGPCDMLPATRWRAARWRQPFAAFLCLGALPIKCALDSGVKASVQLESTWVHREFKIALDRVYAGLAPPTRLFPSLQHASTCLQADSARCADCASQHRSLPLSCSRNSCGRVCGNASGRRWRQAARQGRVQLLLYCVCCRLVQTAPAGSKVGAVSQHVCTDLQARLHPCHCSSPVSLLAAP